MKREKGKQYARTIRQYKKCVKYAQLEYKKKKKESMGKKKYLKN